MKIISSEIKITFFVIFAMMYHSLVYAVPQGYVSPYNGYCYEANTEDELILTVSDTNYTVSYPTFRVTMLRKYVHKVDYETISWPTMPFTDPAGFPWSDTWGLCAYFKDEFGLGMVSLDGPNVVSGQVDMDIWSSIVSGTSSDTFRIIYVDSVTTDGIAQNNCLGCIGVTDPNNKIAFIENTYLEKLVMHEWGHTNDCRTYCGGTYKWAGSIFTHYPLINPNSDLNIMNLSIPDAGLDGDWSFKFSDYPWITPNWWDSKRWNENW